MLMKSCGCKCFKTGLWVLYQPVHRLIETSVPLSAVVSSYLSSWDDRPGAEQDRAPSPQLLGFLQPAAPQDFKAPQSWRQHHTSGSTTSHIVLLPSCQGLQTSPSGAGLGFASLLLSWWSWPWPGLHSLHAAHHHEKLGGSCQSCRAPRLSGHYGRPAVSSLA